MAPIITTNNPNTSKFYKASGEMAQNTGGIYSADGIHHMGAPGVQILLKGEEDRRLQDKQFENQQQLSQQQASQGLVGSQQQGAFQILNTLLNKGYLDENQKNAAMGHWDRLMGNLGDAGGLARQYAQDGGYSPEAMGFLAGEYGNVRGQADRIATQGGLTTDEYRRNLMSGRQDLMNAGRAAAEGTFNQGNPTMSPFGAGAIQAQNAANIGQQMVQHRAGLDQYQADTRMKGTDMLRNLLNDAAGVLGDQAGNKAQGINLLRDLLGIESDATSSMADLEGSTAPKGEDGTDGIVQQLLGSLGDMVTTNTDKKGNKSVETVFQDDSKDRRKTEKAKKPTLSLAGGTFIR